MRPQHQLPPIAATVLATSALGLADFGVRAASAGSASLHGGSLAATLVALALVWGAFGLGASLAARALSRGSTWLAGPQAAPGLAVGVFVLVTLAGTLFGHWNSPLVRLGELAGAACAAALACRLACAVLAPVGVLGRPLPWLGLALVAGTTAVVCELREAQRAPRTTASGPSLLLVTIDTMRADHLGAYGHAAARTPTIDGLAREGVLFENAVTHTVFTGPSHATILSGLLPVQHGLTENMLRLDPRIPTLADRLGAAGWDTGAFVSGFPVTEHASALMSRFATYDDDLRRYQTFVPLARETVLGRLVASVLESRGIDLDPDWRKAPAVTDRAVHWLEGGSRQRPFFGWVHYYDPHLPYEPPERLLSEAARNFEGPPVGRWYHLDPDVQQWIAEHPEARAQMDALYDAEVALVDEQLGRLLAAARARAGEGGLWIVLTADHGESFGEHGIFWRRELYEPTLHVPLIVVPPADRREAIAVARVPQQVRLIDVAPTVLDALGVRPGLDGDGVSLLPLAFDADTPGPGPAISMMFRTRAEPYQRSILSVRADGWKAIWKAPGWANSDARLEGGRRELYDLGADPGELMNRAQQDAERWEALHAHAGDFDLSQRATEELSPEDLKRLRNLGYAE